MKETQRISKLLDQLYHGPSWIEVNILSVIQEITAKQAATKVLQNCNSIWEIINHLISWREEILQRVQGNIKESPADNYFRPIMDSSETAWTTTLQKLEQSQRDWLELLASFDPDILEKSYPSGRFTYYELFHGIIQHDAYHLGQIVLLAKQHH
ncbi:DinB family protein [Flavihumibacter fluvii]|uniref:DinB family protein n=1 Tax=Flavihumibacter fluvii TaxID=2838157 RepID=UPI001BDE8AB7|nr:DinB family protein [Flavihumibacter fluvii]ULQ52674.1 DinB family protein [Flavihumibacter fluvii]